MKKKTERQSTKTHSSFSKRFCMQLKDNRKIFIISFVMQMLGIPLFLLFRYLANHLIGAMNESSADFYSDETLTLYSHLGDLSLIIAVVAAFSGVFTVIWGFRYLNRRSETDLVMSLPVNRTQLFLADFLSGLTTYILPYVIAMISTLPLLISWSHTEKTDDYTTFFFSMSAYCVPPPECILGSEILILIAMFFLYSFTVLSTVCCGTVFDTITSLVIVNYSLYMLCSGTYGIISDETDAYLNYDYMFSRICPPGALLYAVSYLFLHDETQYDYGTVNWIIWILTLSVLCFAAAGIIFKRRKTEDTGKPFAFHPMFCAVCACLTTAVISYIADNRIYLFSSPKLLRFLILSLLASFFIYFILLSVKERKVRFIQSPKKLILPAAVFIIAAGFFAVFSETGAFGAKYYVPYAGAVAEATIDFKPFSGTYTDTETIKLITELHKELNNDLRKSSEDAETENYYSTRSESKTFCSDYNIFSADHADEVYYDTSENITIKYTMKNGKGYRTDFTPCITDYMSSEIYKIAEENYKNSMNDPELELPEILSVNIFGNEHVKYSDIPSEIKKYISDKKYMVFCGRTEYEKELFGCSSVPYVSSTRRYPYEYVLTDFDKNTLDEIISKSYYWRYYDTRDCFVVTVVFDEESTDKETDHFSTYGGNMVWLKKPVKFRLMLPPEYADLYNKLIENSNAEKVEWIEKTDYDYY